jgi:septal ring factor EnvC (AmiA/AmiB activator)
MMIVGVVLVTFPVLFGLVWPFLAVAKKNIISDSEFEAEFARKLSAIHRNIEELDADLAASKLTRSDYDASLNRLNQEKNILIDAYKAGQAARQQEKSPSIEDIRAQIRADLKALTGKTQS